MVQVVRLALGKDWTPARLKLQQKNEATPADNDFLARSNIEFGATATSIEVPLRMLATKIDGADTNLRVRHGSSTDSCPAFFSTDPLSGLQELISNQIRQSRKPSIELAAEVAGVSTRTLQRYLGSKATSYSRLVDQARFNMAMPLLNDESVSISEIAHELGYSNVARFSRAFSRITGMSPRSYRGTLRK